MWGPRETPARWLCLGVCLTALAAGAARAVAMREAAGGGETALRRAPRGWDPRNWGPLRSYEDSDDDDGGGDFFQDDDDDDDDSGESNEAKEWSWDEPPAPRPQPKPYRQTEAAVRCGVTIEVPRITQGKEAQLGEYPWQAAILYQRLGSSERETYCGGALVHPRFVLTAAHCVDLASIRGHSLVEVRLGLINKRKVDKNARALVPDRQIVHPGYRPGVSFRGIKNENDIALLRLPEPAPYTDYIRPVCLPSLQSRASISKAPNALVVAGWGLTEKFEASEVLLSVSLQAVESRACAARHKLEVPDTQLCASGPGGRDSCTGDSGGPLIQAQQDAGGEMAFHVVGVVSSGPSQCGNGAPAVYTRVAPFRAWIDQVVRDNA